MHLTQYLTRFKWYLGVFCITEGLSCASVQFAEQRSLPLKGSFLFFFFFFLNHLLFWLPSQEKQLCMIAGTRVCSTSSINTLSIVSEDIFG